MYDWVRRECVVLRRLARDRGQQAQKARTKNQKSMTLTIKITMDNAAFEPCNGTEAARIRRELATMIEEDNLDASDRLPGLMDVNGNRVGSATVTGRAS